MSTEAQLAHSTRKLNNAIKSKEALSKSESQLQAKVTSLQQELASVTKAAERAQGMIYFVIFILKLILCWHSRGTPTDFRAQCCSKRRKSRRISSTVCLDLLSYAMEILTTCRIHRKASASVLAVDERQSLETLTREEKTAGRILAQASDKAQGFDDKKITRTEELHQQNAKREEVRLRFVTSKPHTEFQ